MANVEPALWRLAPAAVFKPWGLVHECALELAGVRLGVGEFWLASAQTGKDNYSNVVVQPPLHSTLAELLEGAAREGDDALRALLGANAVRRLADNPHRGKTEAWCVRAARGRTGVTAGPRTAGDAERLRDVILGGGLEPHPERWPEEVRRLFGVIEPLRGGEVFYAPAGTLHTMFAIGAGSRLVIDEIQQGSGGSLLPTLTKILGVEDDLLSVQVHPDDETVGAAATGKVRVRQDLQANPTVRVYDFGRRPGEDPELGFSLVRPEAGLRRVIPVSVERGTGRRLEFMVADVHFAKARLTLGAGRAAGLEPACESYHVLHCLQGSADLSVPGSGMRLARGETAFVPSCLESALRVTADADCVLFDDSFPDPGVLAAFLKAAGVPDAEAGRFFAPPRAT